MGHDPEQYPKTGVGERYPELYWRNIFMPNLHINQHKWLIAKDMIDIIDCHKFDDDFDHEIDTTNIWELTRDGAGTYACQNMVNGVVLLETIEEENAKVELTQINESWKLVNCYPLYAEIRCKWDSITEMVFWFGLVTGAGWIAHPDDYVVFMRSSGDASIKFRTEFDLSGNQVDTGIDTEADVWIRLGFHWDGEGTIRWWVIQDGIFPQIILATGSVTEDICQDEDLALGFGVQTDDADDKGMYVDYVKCEQRRVIE